MKPDPFIAVEQPELGLIGPIIYRGYEIEQGIDALINRDTYVSPEEAENRRNSELMIERDRPNASGGTYIVSHRFRNGGRGTIGTREEKKPLLPPPSITPEPQEEPDEDTPFLPANGVRSRRSQPVDDMQDVDLGPQPVTSIAGPVQPISRINQDRIISRGLAAGAAIAGAAAVGATTYIDVMNRPVNTRIPTGHIGDPTMDLPEAPNVIPDPIFNPPETNDPMDSNDMPYVPTIPPIDHDDSEIMDTSDSELVIVKEITIPDTKSTMPAFLTGLTLGTVVTGFVFLL